MRKATLKEQASWLHTTLDVYAMDIAGEFGYDTCKQDEKILVLQAIIDEGLIILPDDDGK